MKKQIKKEKFVIKSENLDVGVHKDSVYIELVDTLEIGRFGIKHRYDPELLSKYRQMINTHRARWDGEEKIWTFPDAHDVSIINMLQKFDYVIIKDKRTKAGKRTPEVKKRNTCNPQRKQVTQGNPCNLQRKQLKKQIKKQQKEIKNHSREEQLKRIQSKGALDKTDNKRQKLQTLESEEEIVQIEVVDVTEVGRFGIKNRYNAELLKKYRKMMSTHQARWDGDEKIWTFPEQYEDSVIDILNRFDNVIIKYKKLTHQIRNRRQPFSAEAASPYMLKRHNILG